MATYTNQKLGIVFDTPEKITVREQLEFMSLWNGADAENERIEKHWGAALTIIKNWRCEWFPSVEEFDIDAPTDDMRHMAAILWATEKAIEFVMRLDALPKESSARPSSAPSEAVTLPQG